VTDRSRTFGEVDLEDSEDDGEEAPDVVLERALEYMKEPPATDEEAEAAEQAA
jgi:hypothetical protein